MPFGLRQLVGVLTGGINKIFVDPETKSMLSYLDGELEGKEWFMGEVRIVVALLALLAYPPFALIWLGKKCANSSSLAAAESRSRRLHARISHGDADAAQVDESGPVVPACEGVAGAGVCAPGVEEGDREGEWV